MIINNSQIPGTLATRKFLFGENKRYAIAAVHTRFDSVSWFVWDAEQRDDHFPEKPRVIRQENSFQEALADFCGEDYIEKITNDIQKVVK